MTTMLYFLSLIIPTLIYSTPVPKVVSNNKTAVVIVATAFSLGTVAGWYLHKKYSNKTDKKDKSRTMISSNASSLTGHGD